MFPYQQDATTDEVDVFMLGLGASIGADRYTVDTDISVRDYTLTIDHPTAGKQRGPLLTQWQSKVYGVTRWYQRQQRWFNTLQEELGGVILLRQHSAWHRDYQLLDHIANEVCAAGYPRQSTALTTWLFAGHLQAQQRYPERNTHNGTTGARQHAMYARLANDSRLNIVQKLTVAAHAIPLDQLDVYLDAGTPFSLIKDLYPTTLETR